MTLWTIAPRSLRVPLRILQSTHLAPPATIAERSSTLVADSCATLERNTTSLLDQLTPLHAAILRWAPSPPRSATTDVLRQALASRDRADLDLPPVPTARSAMSCPPFHHCVPRSRFDSRLLLRSVARSRFGERANLIDLHSTALATPSVMPRSSQAGLVTKVVADQLSFLSSRSERSFHPAQSSSASPSSMLRIG